MTAAYEFRSLESGITLRARCVLPAQGPPPYPVVVMLTGDGPKGTKSLSWANLPPRLAARGIASFLFDFEGLGFSEGERRTLTLTKGIDNLRSAIAFLRQLEWADPNRTLSLASSFGATALLLCPDIANQMKGIGLKSPAPFLADAYLSEVGTSLYDRWAEVGYLEENGYSFEVLLDSLLHNAYASARSITCPCLITHGDADAIVPVQQSKYLSRMLGGKTRLEVFTAVGHGYSEDGAWERMAKVFTDWFASII